MPQRKIPVKRALEIRREGKPWKEVARQLHAEGYPLYHQDSISCKCAKEPDYQTWNKGTRVRAPKEFMLALRAEGYSWKAIADRLVELGYPRWHTSTLCNIAYGTY